MTIRYPRLYFAFVTMQKLEEVLETFALAPDLMKMNVFIDKAGQLRQMI